MGVERTVRLLFLVTSVTLLVVTLGAIHLLQRLAPAAEGIAGRVDGLAASDEALAALAVPGDPDAAVRWAGALDRLDAAAADDPEREALRAARRHGLAAFAGSESARAAAVDAIGFTARARREAVQADARAARRLALGGAWGAVLVGLAGYVASLVVTRRVRRRVVEPILELDRVLTAAARGEAGRRCRPLDAPREVRALVGRVNDLLDRADAATGTSSSPPDGSGRVSSS